LKTSREGIEEMSSWAASSAVEQRIAQVARQPDVETKFPVGPASAKKLGYDPQEFDALPPPATTSRQPVPRNVRVPGLASLLNDTAGEMISPLPPHFLPTVLLGNRSYLGVIEGRDDAAASFVERWSGGRSDEAGREENP
jgi:hypothetical protein